MKLQQKSFAKGMHISKHLVASLLLTSFLHGCALTGSESSEPDQAVTAEAETNPSEQEQTEAVSPELAQAEAQVKALEQQLESLKVEWEQQKPALERLVNSEADLEFLVQALADMSQLAEEPSREQYLGQDELTAEKRAESLQALQSLVTTQEELNTLLVELSTVVSDVAANSQNIGALTAQNSTATTEASEVVAQVEPQTELQPEPQIAQQTAGSGASVVDLSTQQAGQSQGQIQAQYASTGQTVSQHISANCNCSDLASTSTATTDPARSKDPSWYAMTTPYAEATPAGSNGQVSQLDSGAAAGDPIPGLEVKTFKRRTLPSELAAAGADMQQYAMAPQFHMSRKSLSDYVSQLAFKLAGNQQLAGNRIGVASFVFFDEQLEQTSSVGNQLAEELSTVLPSYGARVIEYKLTREITVSPTGDLSLSRNTQKLRDSQGMDYVLTGTMVPTRRGLQINSRVVSTRDNVVIASATTLIPAMVLQQL